MPDTSHTEVEATGTDSTADGGGRRTDVRLVLGVAVLFALLGALLVRVAGGGSLDGVLGAALALLLVTAVVVVFGVETVRAAAELLRP
ncbi:hypothetical protein [Halorarum salinum]|uniref:Uncharacterized protein n=1 Tax=Halorarum salinum TaxID=2743089 RepID=A0A7D5L9S6_9EURY|nr:hypothetical protein [Halobaculum salinum]QLG61553.1 hypothetical protein HUG12_07360 [Halobaculum salinum]